MINVIVIGQVFVVAMTDASSIGKKVLVNADDRARYVLFFLLSHESRKCRETHTIRF